MEHSRHPLPLPSWAGTSPGSDLHPITATSRPVKPMGRAAARRGQPPTQPRAVARAAPRKREDRA